MYETPLVKAKAINVEGRDAVAMELDVPLAALKPGPYLCQLNVIDDAGGSFAFPRFAILVRGPASSSIFRSGLRRCRRACAREPVRAVAAAGAAARASFQVIRRGENHVRSFVVIVSGFERGQTPEQRRVDRDPCSIFS